jgi:NADH:ubiquinone oxidoreductase subunit E
MSHVQANDSLPQDIVDYIEACKQEPHVDSFLISILHRLQEQVGWLSQAHMDEVAQRLQVPSATVSGVATFYHFFRLKPRGQYHISICLGTACFVKGADKILAGFESELGITLGETTPDGLFSLEASRCLGVCALAPVVTINDETYAQVTAKQVPELIRQATVQGR